MSITGRIRLAPMMPLMSASYGGGLAFSFARSPHIQFIGTDFFLSQWTQNAALTFEV